MVLVSHKSLHSPVGILTANYAYREYDRVMYSGDVHVGGNAQVRELPNLIVSKLAVGPYDNNSYLLRCRKTGAQLLIDAAAEPDRLRHLIGSDGLTAVVTTHAHGDHWQALATVVEETGCQSYAPSADIDAIQGPITDPMIDGQFIHWGDCALEVLTVGGHTAGCSMLVYRDPMGHEHLFSGDALFPGGVGKTTTPQDFDTLLTGVTAKAFDQLSDLTWVYPGHGNDTTLGRERPHLAEWKQRGW